VREGERKGRRKSTGGTAGLLGNANRLTNSDTNFHPRKHTGTTVTLDLDAGSQVWTSTRSRYEEEREEALEEGRRGGHSAFSTCFLCKIGP